MGKLISVIIPVYRVEKYLDRCIESIINQTYKNLEIILIDDGSPDNCPTICDNWAKRDARIKVIHKENGGLSSARNAGLDVCQGDCIMFVDSDDYCALEICETLLKLLETNKADFAVCDTQLFDESHPVSLLENQSQVSVYSGTDVIEHIYHSNIRYIVTAWGKLYKRELFATMRYPVGRLHEDEFVFAELLQQTNCFVYVSAAMYYYFQRSSSIMGTKSEKNIQDIYDAIVLRNKYLNEKYPHNINRNGNLLLTLLRSLYISIGKKYKNKSLKKQILQEYKYHYQIVKRCDKKNWLFYNFRWLYIPLLRIKEHCRFRRTK